MPRAYTSRIFVLSFAASILFPFIISADSAPCTEAVDQKNYTKAFEVCLALAEQGDFYAMQSLAYLSVTVKNDLFESYAWYHRAASFSGADASNLLGMLRQKNNENLEMLIITVRSLAASVKTLQQTLITIEDGFGRVTDHSRERREATEKTMNLGLQIAEDIVQEVGLDHLDLATRETPQ